MIMTHQSIYDDHEDEDLMKEVDESNRESLIYLENKEESI
jgi:hypothetical protein